ncbi:MAG: HEAT repeat domain-containing protein [Planctomycetes bacterium]|nr:HEAT repeat domain-containing protein [Planctomycetota bacterium]
MTATTETGAVVSPATGAVVSPKARPRSYRWLAALFVLTLAGCETPPPPAEPPPSIPTTPWSTKAQSVLPDDPSLAHLNVERPRMRADVTDLRASALHLLEQASGSTNALLRANALEAMEEAPSDLEVTVRFALGDTNRGVRFVAAMTIGRLRMDELADLVEPLLDDPSDSVRAAAIYALRRCGRRPDMNPLSRMVMSDDPEVKANAVLVLGELGDPSALPMLRAAARQRSPRVPPIRARIIELQIAEAMVKLGSDRELEAVRAAAFSPPEQAELTVLACLICGRLGDVTFAPSLLDKAMRTGQEREPAEIRLAAVQALAQMDPARAPADVALGYVGDDRYELRMQAAVTLGWLRNPVLLPRLSLMLEDPNPLVQVGAAGAILRTTAPMAAGAGTGVAADANLEGR